MNSPLIINSQQDQNVEATPESDQSKQMNPKRKSNLRRLLVCFQHLNPHEVPTEGSSKPDALSPEFTESSSPPTITAKSRFRTYFKQIANKSDKSTYKSLNKSKSSLHSSYEQNPNYDEKALSLISNGDIKTPNMISAWSILSTFPQEINRRPMKILLVSKDISNIESNSVENFILKLCKVLDQLSIKYIKASELSQAQSLFDMHHHDVVFVDRRNTSHSSSIDIKQQVQLDKQAISIFKPTTAAFKSVGTTNNSVANQRYCCSCLVAIDQLNDDVNNIKNLLETGWDRIIFDNLRLEQIFSEIIQIERNDFGHSLKLEYLTSLQVALENVNEPVEILDSKFRTQFANPAHHQLASMMGEIRGSQFSASNPINFFRNYANWSGRSISQQPIKLSTPKFKSKKMDKSVNSEPMFNLSSGNLSAGNSSDSTTGEVTNSQQSQISPSTDNTFNSPPNLLKNVNKIFSYTSNSLSPGSSALANFNINTLNSANNYPRRQSVPELGSNRLNALALSNRPECISNAVFPIINRHGTIISYVSIRRQGFNSNSVNFVQNQSPISRPDLVRNRSSLTVETPILKLVNILRQAQHSSPLSVAHDLQTALDILQSTDLYSTHRINLINKESDPVTADLIDALLTTRQFSAEGEPRRSNSGKIRRSIAGRPSETMTKQILDMLESLSSNRVGLNEIPEDISESLDGDDLWSYDVLRLENVTNKRPLKFLALRICERFDAIETLKTSETTLANWLTVIEDKYHASNHYHNATHAADVMQSSAYFLDRERLKEIFGPLDEIGTILASIVHDMDHPGRTNPFLINKGAHLALLYNDIAVLESHHISLCFQLTCKDDRINIFSQLGVEDFKKLRHIMVDMVLATEMAKHFEHLTKFNNIVQKMPVRMPEISPDISMSQVDANNSAEVFSENSPIDRRPSLSNSQTGDHFANYDEYLEFLRLPDNRANIRRMLIKCSDINNPTRPLSICKEWANRIAQEYFDQTDEEKQLALPIVMPWFDRTTCDIASSQIKFIDFFLRDMIMSWNEFIDAPELIENLHSNYNYWKSVEKPNASE